MKLSPPASSPEDTPADKLAEGAHNYLLYHKPNPTLQGCQRLLVVPLECLNITRKAGHKGYVFHFAVTYSMCTICMHCSEHDVLYHDQKHASCCLSLHSLSDQASVSSLSLSCLLQAVGCMLVACLNAFSNLLDLLCLLWIVCKTCFTSPMPALKYDLSCTVSLAAYLTCTCNACGR